MRWYCHCNVNPEKAKTGNQLFLFEELFVQKAELSILIEQKNKKIKETTTTKEPKTIKPNKETMRLSFRLFSVMVQDSGSVI